jgi:hypothetical protein
MSLIEDTPKSPEQGAESPAVSTLPDLTQKEVIDTLRQKTGKTVDELMAMDDKSMKDLIDNSFDKKDGGKPGGNTPQLPPAEKVPPGDKPAETPAEESEISVTLKPSLLGPDLRGRKPAEVLIDLIRKAKEGADTVDVLQKRTIPNLNEEIGRRDRLLSTVSTENATLKSELAALRAKKIEEQPPAAPSGTPASAGGDEELPPIPEMPEGEEFDPFNPEDRKKFLGALNAMRKRDEILVKKVNSLAAVPAKRQEADPVAPPPAAPRQPKDEYKAVVDEELQAARQIQSNATFADLMRTTRDITAINEDYVTFGQKIATLVGITKAVDDNGLFTHETNNVLSDYFNPVSPEGEKIRSAAKSRGIEPPAEAELTALRRITTVRSIQKSRFTRDGQGNVVPISADEAFVIAQGINPHLFKNNDPVAARRAELEATERAIKNREAHTTDVPPAIGADVNDVSKIPMERFLSILKKPADKWSVEEAEAVKAVMKANNLIDDEIKYFVDQQKPKP